jgi:hypothetical protein
MTRVNLVGPADDGLHLVVETDGGERFTLPITDELRHAVRYARPKYRPADEEDSGDGILSPREIQQRIRAGLSAAELAELTGMDVAALEKYEPPVIAERAYIAELAQTTRIGRDSSAPLLGELVTDRLAGRGVDPESIAWDAWREVDAPWQVCVDFSTDGRRVRALWTFDHSARTLTAEDEESRWLTETELLDVPIPRRHLAAVRHDDEPLPETRPAMPTAVDAAEEPEETPTERLLEDLDGRRGTREPVQDELDLDDEDFEGFGPAAKARMADVSFTPRTEPDSARGATMPHPAGSARDDGDPTAEDKPTPRKGRASVPSWDEIVFGARNDQG